MTGTLNTKEIAVSIIQGALLQDIINKDEMMMIKRGIKRVLK